MFIQQRETDTVSEPPTELEERTEKLDKANRKLAAIKAAEIEVEECKDEWDAAKKDASDLKKDYDAAVERLCKIIKFDVDQQELPFPPEEATEETSAEETSVAAPDWGLEHVGVLAKHGLTAKRATLVALALEDHGFDKTRVVDLRDWILRDDYWQTKIKGIGCKPNKDGVIGTDGVVDALNSYYAAHPESEAGDEIPGEPDEGC
jgi:hypothetical protein